MTSLLLGQVGNEGLASEDDADTEEALKEFDFLVTAEDGEGAGEARSSGDGTEWGEYRYLKILSPLKHFRRLGWSQTFKCVSLCSRASSIFYWKGEALPIRWVGRCFGKRLGFG